DLIRLTGAAMLAELVLRGAGTDASPDVFDVLVEGLDNLAVTAMPDAPGAGRFAPSARAARRRAAPSRRARAMRSGRGSKGGRCRPSPPRRSGRTSASSRSSS